jgi:hypothetical protein
VSQLRKLIVPLMPFPDAFPDAVLLDPEQAETSDDEATAARAAPADPAIKRRRDIPVLSAAFGTDLRVEAGWLFMTVTP